MGKYANDCEIPKFKMVKLLINLTAEEFEHLQICPFAH